MDPVYYPPGTVLFREGDSADAAYLVQEGSVEILIDDAVVNEIKPGTIFGEMALISNAPRMATARTKGETACIVVPRSVFNSILNSADAFTRALILSLIQHVRSSRKGDDDSDVQFFMPQRDGSYREQG